MSRASSAKRDRENFEGNSDASLWDALGTSLVSGVKFVLSSVSGLFSEADERKRPTRTDGFTQPFDAGLAFEPLRPRDSSFAMDFSGVDGPNGSFNVGRTPLSRTRTAPLDAAPYSPIAARPATSPNAQRAIDGGGDGAALPSYLDLIEQSRLLEQFERSVIGTNTTAFARPNATNVSASKSFSLHDETLQKPPPAAQPRTATPQSVRRTLRIVLPPLDAMYRDDNDDSGVEFVAAVASPRVRTPAKQHVSLVDVATPPDSHTALNRLRILSEKFGNDPNSVPASMEEHLQWVREQDELDRAKAAAAKSGVRRALTDAQMALYNRAMGGGPDDQVVTDKYVNDMLQMDLKRYDIAKMGEGKWLNDECVNLYMKILQKRADDDKRKLYFFNSFFYEKLQDGYAKVQRWTRRVDVFAKDKVIFPVHLGTHWCLGIINFRERRFEYYDSLHGDNDLCLRLMRQYVEAEHLDKKKKPFDFTGWKDSIVNGQQLPLQRNGSDCGVFACLFGEYFARDAQPDFTQSDMPLLRKRMAVELLTGKLIV